MKSCAIHTIAGQYSNTTSYLFLVVTGLRTQVGTVRCCPPEPWRPLAPIPVIIVAATACNRRATNHPRTDNASSVCSQHPSFRYELVSLLSSPTCADHQQSTYAVDQRANTTATDGRVIGGETVSWRFFVACTDRLMVKEYTVANTNPRHGSTHSLREISHNDHPHICKIKIHPAQE